MEVDQLGYSTEHRCPHCKAAMYVSDNDRLICLNACEMPVWQYRIMQQGLAWCKNYLDAEEKRKAANS